MAVALSQIVTEDRASGGQIIDGSLRFDSNKSHYLNRTPGSAGNRRTWTWSGWVKRGSAGGFHGLFGAENGTDVTQIRINSANEFMIAFFENSTYSAYVTSSALMRDHSAWYHCVAVVDTTVATSTDRMILYINGVRQTINQEQTITQNYDTAINSTVQHNLGANRWNSGQLNYLNGSLTEVNFIDGQALDASDFGFTDSLTNTWRPKKYTGTYGTNGFYLPLDGNSLIEEDKSGNGNDFTPVNFGGSNTLEKATGAFPILNTTNGGRVATVGVRTDTAPGNGPVGVSTHLILALPLVGSANDVSNQINSSRTALTFTAQGNAAPTTIQSNFYGGSYTFDGTTDRLFTSLSNGDALYLQGSNFTVECWVRLASGQTDDRYMVHVANGNQSNSNGSWQMRINASKFNPGFTEGTTQYNMQSTSNYVPNKWTHVAFVREGNEQRLYIDGRLDATTSYTQTPNNLTSGQLSIGGSWDNGGGTINGQIQDVRVYDGVAKYTSNFIPASTDPDILPDTPSGVAGGSALTSIPDSATEGAVAFDGSGDNLSFSLSSGGLGSGDFTLEYFVYQNTLSDYQTHFGVSRGVNGFNVGTDASGDFVLYSASARQIEVVGAITTGRWYHWAFVRSGSTLTGYLDGRAIDSYSSSENFSGTTCTIGSLESNSEYTNGFISNFRILKGTALYTSDFTPPTAPLTNVTNTTLLCCQSTTSATVAAVAPGSITANGNAIASKFSPFLKENINAVRGQESGYAVLNPVSFRGNGTITNGNLTMAATDGDCSAAVTLQIPTGNKIYLEAQHNITLGAGNRAQIGVVNVNVDTGTNAKISDGGAGGWAYDFSTSSANSGAYDEGTRTAYPDADDGDICMWCIDLSAGLMWAGKNGIWFNGGNPAAGSGAVITGIPDTATGLKVTVDGGSTNRSELIYNFGQKPFKYAPPEGFKPLCLANLDRPTSPAAVRPETYVGIHTYVGTGSEHDIPNAFGFDPDFLWTRRSDATGDRHNWYDKVRGDDGTRMYVICPELGASQATRTESTTAMVRSSQWPRHGFRVGTNGQTNSSGAVYTAFGLKAGGAPVSNTDGSITTQVSASPESGFSIIGYTGNQTTGASIGHGLNQAPEMLIFKSLSEDRGWLIWHKDLNAGRGDYTLAFNALKRSLDSRTDRPLKDTGCTTDTTIILGLDSEVNHNNEMICYAFHSVPGVVKVGRYDGNGSTTDGPFVNCGFRPKFVIAKNYAGGSETNWFVKDAENSKFNQMQFTLYLNTSDARVNNFPIDFYSNGFKLRDDNALINESGSNYIYIAFAEAPINNLYGAQANAR